MPAFMQDSAFLMNKYPFLQDARPFNQAPFDSRLFTELKGRVSNSVNFCHAPSPLRNLLEDVWASLHSPGAVSHRAGVGGNEAQATGTGLSGDAGAVSHRAGVGGNEAQATGTGLSGDAGAVSHRAGFSGTGEHDRGAETEATEASRAAVHNDDSVSGVKHTIIQRAREAEWLQGKAKREKLISAWQLAGEQLVGSRPGAERFVTFAKEYFHGSALVPPLCDLIYGNTATGKIEFDFPSLFLSFSPLPRLSPSFTC